MPNEDETKNTASGRLFYKKLKQRNLDAIWNSANSKHGSTILALRHRGWALETRANLILLALIVTVCVGLFFYIVIPILQNVARSEAAFYQTQLDAVETQETIQKDVSELRETIASELQDTFAKIETGTLATFTHVWMSGENNLLKVANSEANIMYSDDRGRSWTTQRQTVPKPFSGQQIISDDGSLILNHATDPDDSPIFHLSSDLGESWFTHFNPRYEGFNITDLVIVERSQTQLVLISNRSTIYATDEDWRSWKPEYEDTSVIFGLNDVAISPNKEFLLLVGHSGRILRKNPGQTNWEPIVHPSSENSIFVK